jgi:hypothetical protein
VEAVRREFFRRWSVGASVVMDYRAHYIAEYRKAYSEIWENCHAVVEEGRNPSYKEGQHAQETAPMGTRSRLGAQARRERRERDQTG